MQSDRYASKGSVSVENNGGRLRLRLPRQLYKGKQKYLTLGLDDTPGNRAIAQAKAKQIESDILYERFDLTLNKYRPEHMRMVNAEQTETFTDKNLKEVWREFSAAKKNNCAPGTWKNGYMVITSHLSRCPYDTVDDAQEIADWAQANLTPNTAKRFLMQLSACCNWAVKLNFVRKNPFDGMAGEIKVTKKSSEDNEIDPFTADERDRIIEEFSKDRYYSYYVNYVKFLFYSGCRPSEAVGLQWKHISPDFTTITFEQSVVMGANGLELKKGLKTQGRRSFPINSQLKEILQSIGKQNSEALVFPAPEGGWIDIHNFRNRAWKTVLSNLDIKYRKPYQTRHTFITLCVLANVPVKRIASWVGNSPSVIMQHYTGKVDHIQVPEI
jgi:integrase